MAQTIEGAKKVAAKKAMVSVAVYNRFIGQGNKWCSGCKKWHARISLGKDSSRFDGLAAQCILWRKKIYSDTYVPKPPLPNGRKFSPPRDGDKSQARHRINYYVVLGLIPSPNSLPCHDCGHIYKPGKIRHEYGHYKGYGAAHHEDVQSVCRICHTKRFVERGEGKLKTKRRSPSVNPKPQPGEDNPSAKLTWKKVDFIRKSFASGTQAECLADEFKVSKSSIYTICRGESWRKNQR